MARNTYWARMLLAGDDLFAVEQPTTSTAGHPYHELPMCLAVHNRVGSGKLVYIHVANVKPVTTAQQNNAMVQYTRITAASSGIDTVTPFPHDSTSTALPSQIECLYLPSSVTKTAGSQYRRMTMQPMFNQTRVLSALVARTGGDGRSGNDSSEVYAETDADTGGWILRAGEGLCLELVNTDLGAINAFSVTMVFNVGAETWRVNKVIEPRMWHKSSGAVLSLMNNTGSGVVLDVQRIQVREIGTDDTPQVYYEPLDYVLPDAADAELVSFSGEPLPASVLCKRNTYAQRQGAKSGGLINIPAIRRVQLSEPPWYPGVAGLQFGRRGLFERDVDLLGTSQFVLGEGEGFGVRKSNGSSMVCHDAYIMFSIVDNHFPRPVFAIGGLP